MKCYTILAVSFLFVSLSTAAPAGKGKGRAVDKSKTSKEAPTVPPLPGRTGTHQDPKTGIFTLHYGDDDMPEHMGHLQRNQAKYPENLNPMSLAPSENNDNRKNAVSGIPSGLRHPVSGLPLVRDEKPLHMLQSPNHATSTTVEMLPAAESQLEAKKTAEFSHHLRAAGPDAKGQLRPNPGWLPLHPGQRRGHEAPAKLNPQTLRPNPSPSPGPSHEPTPSKGEEKKKPQKVTTTQPATSESHIPLRREGLRPRPGKPPPPPVQKKEKITPRPDGKTNLQPGRVAPPGHVWKPSNGVNHPSHVGAPGHLPGSEKRHPPRPQNREQYMKQQQKKDEEEKKKQASSQNRPVPSNPPKDPKPAANLARFEKDVGPAKKGNGAGRANEAPARLPVPRPAQQSLPSRPPGPASKRPIPPPNGPDPKRVQTGRPRKPPGNSAKSF